MSKSEPSLLVKSNSLREERNEIGTTNIGQKKTVTQNSVIRCWGYDIVSGITPVIQIHRTHATGIIEHANHK